MKNPIFFRTPSHWTKSLAILALSVAAPACRQTAPPKSMILITLDTQRADYIGAYGMANVSTPNIDRVARDGILFRNAYSLIPITLPAHASLFFSEPPHAVGSYNNGQKFVAARHYPSFVNLFQKKGFATAAFVSLGVLTAPFGLNQGFDSYEDKFPQGRWYLSAGEVNERVFPWLEKNAGRPFFLWIHYSDPHAPYAPPDSPIDFRLFLNDHLVTETSLQKYEFNPATLDLKPGKNELRIGFESQYDVRPGHYIGRLDWLKFEPEPGPETYQMDFLSGWFIRQSDQTYFFNDGALIEIRNGNRPRQVHVTFRGGPILTTRNNRRQYRREVEYMDREIGRLWEKLAELGLFDKSAILIVGDHGEGLGEYRTDFGDPHIGHIHFLYDVYLRVPLIIRDPTQKKRGIVRDEYATLLDVGPTFAAMAGLKPYVHSQGRNLLRLKKRDPHIIFQETHRPEAAQDRFGLLFPPWHAIFTVQKDRFELYHLRTDPEEKRNLLSDQDWPPDLGALRQKLENFARQALSRKPDILIDDKTKEILRALGYIR